MIWRRVLLLAAVAVLLGVRAVVIVTVVDLVVVGFGSLLDLLNRRDPDAAAAAGP